METHLNPRKLKRSFVFTSRKELANKRIFFCQFFNLFLATLPFLPGRRLKLIAAQNDRRKTILKWTHRNLSPFNYIFSKLAFIIWLQHQKLQRGSFVQIKILENNRSRIYAKMHDNSIVVSLSPWIQLQKFLLSQGLFKCSSLCWNRGINIKQCSNNVKCQSFNTTWFLGGNFPSTYFPNQLDLIGSSWLLHKMTVAKLLEAKWTP